MKTFTMFKQAKLLILLFVIAGNGFVYSQEERYLEIRGIAELDMNPISGAIVTIFEGDEKIDSDRTTSTGVFTAKFDVNKYYIVEVAKEGYKSKRIAFDTHLPDDITGKWVMEFSMSVVKSCEGVNYAPLDEPVDIIKYNKRKKDFVSDDNYAFKMRTRLEKMMYEYQECINQKYEDLTQEADELYNNKEYEEAKAKYEEAVELLPNERYAREMVSKADDAISKTGNIEELYRKTVGEADALMAQKKYDEALLKYKGAQTLKPQEQYAQGKIIEIQSIQAKTNASQQEQMQTQNQYNALIAQANAEFAKKNYAGAKQLFESASLLKPQEQFPKVKIQEINLAITQQRNLAIKNREEQAKKEQINKEYQNLIAQADNLIKQNKPQEALEVYNKALTIKPQEQYPLQRVSQLNNQIAAKEQQTEAAYQAAITKGNSFLNAKNYILAKENYTNAMNYKPGDAFAQSKITEIENLIRLEKEKEQLQQAELQRKYNFSVQKGDNLLSSNNLDAAKAAYQQALILKPEEQYPRQKISVIDQQLAEQARKKQEIEAGYQTAMSRGNSFLSSKNFEQAKTNFQQALAFKPGDIQAQAKINELENLVKQQEMARKNQAIQLQYTTAVQKADNLFNSKDYTAAKQAYQDALTIKPQETYPKQKIQQIDQLIAQETARKQREIAAGYQSAILQGNTLFNRKDYINAKSSYEKALTYKPNDVTAKNKILEIDNILKAQQAQLAAVEAKKKQYDGIIIKADQLYNSKQYNDAKTEYQKANQLMPTENYPTIRIAEINRILAEQKRILADQQQKENAYKLAISNGDLYLANKNYQTAKSEYNKALTIKPNEVYPKSKISEIDRILAAEQKAIADKKALDEKYNNTIAQADRLFNNNNFSEAKTFYNQALNLKPSEVYPTNQISKIENILAQREKEKQEQLAKKQQYDKLIAEADGQFNAKQYFKAKTIYQQALDIIPNEQYPRARIEEIDRLVKVLAQQERNSNISPAKTSTTKTKSKIADLVFKNEGELAKYLKQLRAKYPEGITHEVYKEKYRITERYIVIRGELVREFREVTITTYGGKQYTMNGKAIDGMFFNNQVKRREGEYYKKFEF